MWEHYTAPTDRRCSAQPRDTDKTEAQPACPVLCGRGFPSPAAALLPPLPRQTWIRPSGLDHNTLWLTRTTWTWAQGTQQSILSCTISGGREVEETLAQRMLCGPRRPGAWRRTSADMGMTRGTIGERRKDNENDDGWAMAIDATGLACKRSEASSQGTAGVDQRP